MARNRPLKRKKGYHSGENMLRAIVLHRQGKSIRNAAQECHINYVTLYRYIHKYKHIDETSLQSQRLTPNYGVNKTFTVEQELLLKEYIKEYAFKLGGVSSKEVRRIAYQMAKVNNTQCPASWAKKRIAGVDWYRTYKLRHPDLKVTNLDHTTDFDEETVRIELEQRAKGHITKIVSSVVEALFISSVKSDESGDDEDDEDAGLASKEKNEEAVNDTNNRTEVAESTTDVSCEIDDKEEKGENDKRNITTCSDEAYSNALATGVNIIIARVYKFFKTEYEYLNKNYGELFDVSSFSDYKERTAEATGFDIDVVSRALDELEIQDGCPKKRKLDEEDDSQSSLCSGRDCDLGCKYSNNLGATGDNCQRLKLPDHNNTPDVSEPPAATSDVARLAEGSVIYEMQSKPTQETCIKVENEVNNEEMQVICVLSSDSHDPLKMETDYDREYERDEIQLPNAVMRNPMDLETDNFEGAEHLLDGSLVIKEEIDIGEEEFS